MEITELAAHKGDTWLLQLDGDREQTYFVNVSVVNDFLLKKGQEISGEVVAQLCAQDTLRKAKRRALYLLGTRQYCRAELVKKLQATYSSEVAREAVDYICELGYVNDEEYAPKLAEYLIHTKHYGLRKTRFEMLHRGLDENLVEDALAQFGEDEIDEEITSLLERKYYAKILDYSDRQRTIAALARRGYDYRSVKRCIGRLLEQYEEEYVNDEDFE